MVSAQGHFLSFVVVLLMSVSMGSVAVAMPNDETGAAKKAETIFLFFGPTINVFVHPLIQTVFSHRLRESLFGWHQQFDWTLK